MPRAGAFCLAPHPAPRRTPVQNAACGLAAAAIAAAVLWPGSAPATHLTGSARVVDGDTLVVQGRRVRLRAMDAPEMAQTCGDVACGKAAKARLVDLVGHAGGIVTCTGGADDRYGRLVAICEADGRDVAEVLVREGLAVAYRQYGKRYVAAEEEAKAAQRGIWATKFQMPAEWRQEQRQRRRHER